MFRNPRSVQTRAAARKELSERELSSVMEQGVSTSDGVGFVAREVEVRQSVRSVVKSEGSVRSTRTGSTRLSTETRRKQLILEAAAAKAYIEKDLIEKRLAADLAAIEDEEGFSAYSGKSRREIDEWIDTSHGNEPGPSGAGEARDTYAAAGPPAPPVTALTDIEKLAGALHQAVLSSVANALPEQAKVFTRTQQVRDLPNFSGDSIEWLYFKKAYDETAILYNLSEAERVYHLRRCLHGDAREAVASLLMCGARPDQIMETLELRFGRSDVIILKIVTQLKRMSPLPSEYHRDIAVFATKIQNFVTAAHAIQETDYLRSPELTSTVLSKLPSALITRWTDYVCDQRAINRSKFELLSDFLMNEATKVAKAGVSYLYSLPEKRATERRPQLPHLVHMVGESQDGCKFCKLGNHALTACQQFKRAMRRDRWRFVRIHRLCYKCLQACPDRRACPAEVCDVDECGRDHHRLLHWRARPAAVASASPPARGARPDCEYAAPGAVETVTTAIASLGSKVLLKVVPVTLHGPNKSVSTYALLDDGSTVSLISAEIANEVGLQGRSIAMRLRSAWDSSEIRCESELVKCELSNTDGEVFELGARKTNSLQLATQYITGVDFEHLNSYFDCKMFNVMNAYPTILIGQDNYHLLLPQECLRVSNNGPYATRTLLGWSMHGALRTSPRPSRLQRPPLPLESLLHVCHADPLLSDCVSASTARDDGQSLAELSELVRNSFLLDAIGIGNSPRKNKEEQLAVAILSETASLVDGQWEVGLPWRSDAALPDSYPNAHRRLMYVEKKNIRNPEYGTRYQKRIMHLFDNGYAREVSDSKPAGTRIWYLPHFGVDNPNKKKLRIVFDSAASSGGHSLNDYLLQGPNLLESLLGIMFRFREGRIAVIGDIKDMFLRVKIRQEDQDAFRFLWRNNNQTEPVKKFAMTSLIFGANCSPFVAQFIKNRNAERFVNEMPEAVNAIIKSHYMDDYIDSHNDIPTAKQLINQITYIHKCGGFEIRNWSSNEPRVIEDVPKAALSDRAIEFKINDQERTLGLFWYLASDTLCFDLTLKRISADILSHQRTPTKRELLRLVMSIYDVYGFLAPFTIKAKILLQLVWKKNIRWDEELPNDQVSLFKEWATQLGHVKGLRIPRWYFNLDSSQNSEPEMEIELHVFCDASPAAYAAVAYWRKEYRDGSVCVSLIASKTRVTPIKSVTIPRLELQAALLACRLANTITTEHRIAASKKYFWCDSTTVLHWIKNENRNYNIFIANRLGEIDTLSNISEWYYIPTYMNIADVATKLNKYNLSENSEWFKGPLFLRAKPINWPEQPKLESQDILVSEDLINIIEVYDLCLPAVPDPSRFSSWNRLRRSAATVLLFVERCKKSGLERIDCELLYRAETLLLRYSQIETFSRELQALKTNNAIAKDSRLRTLTPFVDEEGVLRVGGRIDAVQNVLQQTKRPVILDGRHRVARLLVKHHHEAAAHGCNELVVNELRQRYWIINLRPTVRSVASQCIFCRTRKTKPNPPRMGDLPGARLLHHHRPFTNCGVDLFGPMDIAVGRRREKRYGVLFTCLTVRAIHIEIVSDLSTDTVIMALRRMAARRGWPSKLFSDNGTNFRGADKELKRSFAALNKEEMLKQASNRGVDWQFLPPVSPHMAGAWERLIKSVKTALRVVLKERAPREETLFTMLLEVEGIVNSRPLTHVSVECDYDEALTPNHFLLGTSSPAPRPGSFDDHDLNLRRQWRIAQRLTDMFWRRWMKEVLPTLLPRTKWYREQEAVKPGDLVLVVDPNLARNTWPRGLVLRVHPGRDGRIRVVDVKTKSGILTRPVTRVALIPQDECLLRLDGTGAENVDDVQQLVG